MIISKILGGLGNQIFQYLAGLSVAQRHGVEHKLDTWILDDDAPWETGVAKRSYALDIFDFPKPARASKWEVFSKMHVMPYKWGNRWLRQLARPFVSTKRLYRENNCAFEEIPSDAYMEVYWQRWDIVSPTMEQARKMLSSHRYAEQIQKTQLYSMMKEADNPVCMSVRRGDFIGNSTFDLVSHGYYRHALKLLGDNVGKFTLFLFSDDITWCKNELDLPYAVKFADSALSGDDGFNHFFLMQECHHFIIPNSTFHYWGAMLSAYPGKKVIAPQIWLKGQTHKSPILPPEWIAI